MALRAAGYCRVSTEGQARDGISLADQDHRVREFIASKGWECVGVFSEDIPGSVPFAERPAGREAFEADVDCLVVVAWDRLGRDAADFLAVVRDRRVESVTESGEPPLLRDLRAVLAQEERRKIAERTKAAAAAMAREGRYNGPRPCGYVFEDGRLVENSAEVPVVRRIYSAAEAGVSLSAIARDLNADGVPTVKGGRWTRATVQGMLTNPVYVGKVRSGNEVVEGLHAAIVGEEVWNRVQRLLTPATATRRGRPPVGSHLFTRGLLRCGRCGEAMVPRTRRGRDGKLSTETYVCRRYLDFGREGCETGEIRRDLVDPAVYGYFENIGLDVEATRRQVVERLDERLVELQALTITAEGDLAKAEERLERVRRDYTDGKLSAEDWAEFKAELSAQRDAARAKQAQLSKHVATVTEETGSIDAEQSTLQHLTAIRNAVAGEVRDAEGIDAARAAISRLFERFVLHPAVGAKLGPQKRGEPFEGPDRAPLLDVDGYMIELWVREEVVEVWEPLRLTLRRTPLGNGDSKPKTIGVSRRPSS